MDYIFEELCIEHMNDVIDLLNYYIKSSTDAYRDQPVCHKYFKNMISSSDYYSGFAIKNEQGHIVGFCLLERFKSYSTFIEVGEPTYFIHPNYLNRGIGSLALNQLEAQARVLGIKKLLVNISSENEKSRSFHNKHGFIEYGRLKDVGRKFDRYFSLIWMGKEL